MKKVVLVLAVLVLMAWAFHNKFVCDDAFISFRYADNLVRGKGLVFNEGERIEGYTNFLWVLLMAGGVRLGFDPVVFSQALGLVAFTGCLLLTYRMATKVLGSEWLGLVAVVLLGTSYTFSSFATGGLETSLQACLLTGSVALTIGAKEWTPRRLVTLSLLLAAAVLTRPDSVLFVGVLFPVVGFCLLRERSDKQRVWEIVALVVPFLLIMATWLAWKVGYYGNIFPNTFYAKAAGSSSVKLGWRYVLLFARTYSLWPFVLLGFAALPAIVKRQPMVLLLFALTMVWVAYVVWVGGDFMEFRFMVPVLPLIMTLIAWLTTKFVSQKGVQIALVAMVVLGSLNHRVTYGSLIEAGPIEPIKDLHGHVWKKGEGWATIGRKLAQIFGPNSDVVIATTAAGVIPFYSGLATVDMLGLTDAWVARHGIDLSGMEWPGHRRMAPLEYLVQRQVNLVLGNPKVRRAESPEVSAYCGDLSPVTLVREPAPQGTAVVEIPLHQERVLVVLYLTPSSEVDEAIKREGWRVYNCQD